MPGQVAGCRTAIYATTGTVINPRPVGDDEVALCHPCCTATYTDCRLFAADYGNDRIISAKLGYHADEKIGLKDVPDQGKK